MVGEGPGAWVARTPLAAAALVWVTGLKPARVPVTFTVTGNPTASAVGVYVALGGAGDRGAVDQPLVGELVPAAQPVVSAVSGTPTVGAPPGVTVGTGAGAMGAAPTTAVVVQSTQVPPRVAARATPLRVLPVGSGVDRERDRDGRSPGQGGRGTAQVSTLPAWVTPLGRVPMVASSRMSVGVER